MLLFISLVSTFCQAQARVREEEALAPPKGKTGTQSLPEYSAGHTIIEARTGYSRGNVDSPGISGQNLEGVRCLDLRAELIAWDYIMLLIEPPWDPNLGVLSVG